MSNHWYVVKTKPKKEEAVMRCLEKASFEIFFPRMKSIKGKNDRR